MNPELYEALRGAQRCVQNEFPALHEYVTFEIRKATSWISHLWSPTVWEGEILVNFNGAIPGRRFTYMAEVLGALFCYLLLSCGVYECWDYRFLDRVAMMDSLMEKGTMSVGIRSHAFDRKTKKQMRAHLVHCLEAYMVNVPEDVFSDHQTKPFQLSSGYAKLLPIEITLREHIKKLLENPSYLE